MAEEIQDIADDSSNDWIEIEKRDGTSYEIVNKEAVLRSRLRVDTRKWLMSKLKPKKYGEKLDLTSGGDKIPQASNEIVFVNFGEDKKEKQDEKSNPASQ